MFCWAHRLHLDVLAELFHCLAQVKPGAAGAALQEPGVWKKHGKNMEKTWKKHEKTMGKKLGKNKFLENA